MFAVMFKICGRKNNVALSSFVSAIFALSVALAFSVAVCSCKSGNVAENAYGGVAVAGDAPNWVFNPSVVYNQNIYMTNVGTGRDRDAAQTNALSGIAAVFGQNVNTVTTSKEIVSQTDATYQHNRQVEQNIQREVQQNEMLGVSVDSFWYDGKSVWYAIAVINRANASSLYESRIKKNNSEISRLLEFARSGENANTLAAYARYNSAAALAADNDVYITRLSVLDISRGEVMRRESVSGVSIRNSMHELVKQIPIAVQISGDADGTIKSSCAQVFSAHGFATAEAASGAARTRYVLAAEYKTESAFNSSKTIVYCRYSLVGYLSDALTGERLLPISLSGREGAANQDESERRALSSLKKNLVSSFSDKFSDYLENLH